MVDEEKKRMIFVTLYTGILSVEMFGKMDYSLTGYNLKEYLSQIHRFVTTIGRISEEKQDLFERTR